MQLPTIQITSQLRCGTDWSDFLFYNIYNLFIAFDRFYNACFQFWPHLSQLAPSHEYKKWFPAPTKKGFPKIIDQTPGTHFPAKCLASLNVSGKSGESRTQCQPKRSISIRLSIRSGNGECCGSKHIPHPHTHKGAQGRREQIDAFSIRQLCTMFINFSKGRLT